MGYILPSAVPAWKVTKYFLATSNPMVAAKVGWLKSDSEPVRTFRSLEAAQSHARRIEARANWSLIPIEYEGRIELTSRRPDIWDKIRAALNMRPYCGDTAMLSQTWEPTQ